MSGVSDYGKQYWLNVLFGNETPVTGYWVALLTEPGDEGYDGDVLADIEPPRAIDDGTGTMLNTAYDRMQIPTGAANWEDAEGGFTTNVLPLSFPSPTQDWGNITGFALCTAHVSGQVYAFGEFSNPQAVLTGAGFTVPPGGLTITLSGKTNTIVV